MTSYWHFTSTAHLPRILNAGLLKLTESNIGDPTEGDHYGPDVLWLLDTPNLGGFNHGLTMPKGLKGPDKRRVRFEVDVPDSWVRGWGEWAVVQGISRDWRQVLIDTAGGTDAAKHWYVSLREVPRNRWVRVEDARTNKVLWEPDDPA